MNKDIKKIIGQRLQLLRIERNYTQEQISDILNISTSAYCKIEYGITDITLSRLYEIAHALNISVFSLFNKLNKNTHFDSETTVQPENIEKLIQQIRSNRKSIDMLEQRINLLEKDSMQK